MGEQTNQQRTSQAPDPAHLSDTAAADPDLVGMVAEVFGDYRTGREALTETIDLDDALWRQLESLGLTTLTTSEERGGGGASWVDAAAVLGEAAAAAAPVPLAEHDLLAGWLLEVAGLPPAQGPRTVCRPDAGGRATAVPWASACAGVVALWVGEDGPTVVDVPVSDLDITPGRDLSGRPSDVVQIQLSTLRSGVTVPEATPDGLRLRQAVARCAQAAGAMSRVVDVVVEHVNTRTQFGRPVGRFQAVQHLVADLAAEAALARAATDSAVARATTLGWQDPATRFAVAVAASCTGHAASVVVRNAHQAMGAIGTTVEHELHLLTKPILVWRSDTGSVHGWDAELTDLALSAGREGLWSLVTGATPPEVRPHLTPPANAPEQENP